MTAIYLWTNGDIITPLAEPLEIEGYGCGVIGIHGKFTKRKNSNTTFSKPLYLCSDICEEVYVNHIKLPSLIQFRVNGSGVIDTSSANNILWIPITRTNISKIRLYITNDRGEIQSFSGKGLYCTLLLIPHKK